MSAHDIERAARRQDRRDAAARREYRQAPDLVVAFVEVFGRDVFAGTCDMISLEADPDTDTTPPQYN